MEKHELLRRDMNGARHICQLLLAGNVHPIYVEDINLFMRFLYDEV